SPLIHIWSRRFEYEADAFARATMGEAQSLVQALRKLSEKNLSNLTPHSLYSSFYYSHPTLLDRERALEIAAKRNGRFALCHINNSALDTSAATTCAVLRCRESLS